MAKDNKQGGLKVWEATDATEFITKYSVLLIVVVALLLGGVVGYGFYQEHAEKSRNANLEKIYYFQNGALKQFSAKKIKVDVLLTEFKQLQDDLGISGPLAVVGLEVASALVGRSERKQAIAILRPLQKRLRGNSVLNYYLTTLLAVYLEDSGEAKESIALLESLLNAKLKFMEAKIYLDLGRMYLAQEDSVRARTNLQYVLDKFPKDEMALLARIYLTKISAKVIK